MSTKRICICGHFGFGQRLLNGQTIKTKILCKELQREYGDNDVYIIDSHGKSNSILLFFRLLYGLVICRNIIILPAHNGIRIIPLWLCAWNFLFKRKLHYVVIGGWIAKFSDRHCVTKWALRYFHNIYCETSTLQKELANRGYNNAKILPNCKYLTNISEDAINYSHDYPLHLVIFSRIMQQKGIADAVHVIEKINKDKGAEVYRLDIYGQIENSEIQWFTELQRNFTTSVRYKGHVDFDKSAATLVGYYALIFPTLFFTEGIPGTIIDAYAAGLPVIASQWESYKDIIIEEETGFSYKFGDIKALEELLRMIAETPEIIIKIKRNCIKKAQDYTPQNVVPLMNLS